MSYVIKRSGEREPVHFDKITRRIERLCHGLDERFVDPVRIAQKVIQGVYPGVTTVELDELAAQTAAYCATQHPDYSKLAARIAVSNLHKQSEERFSEAIEKFHNYVHPKTGASSPLVSREVYEVVKANAERLDNAVQHERDFEFEYFGFKTLEKSYLFKLNGKVEERPQHMIMRVAVGIHLDDLDAAIETYNLMSQKLFTHATPTLFNSGTPHPQMSSCFLLCMKADSIPGIFETLKRCAVISKHAGGIGLSVHNIRATNSYIAGTNGTSNGLVPMLRVFNNTARYVDQGGGKRKGSIAIYLEPWHSDIFEWLDLRKNHGNELERARDLFYGLWVPDLFMERVEANAKWSLFCPNEAPGLADCWGADFKELYETYEAEGRARSQVDARRLWFSICEAQVETGTPYILYKDACNSKSNQQNLGCIKSSNLCTEIVEYTAPDEVAVCNLASISLSAMVIPDEDRTRGGKFDFQKLYEVTKVVARNLNKVIDRNFYPLEEARNSNMRHRPIGIGVQGLADCFCLMRYPFESEEAAELNRAIFETIYFGAVEASCELAERDGPYSSYEGSPMSQGNMQFDMWGVKPSDQWDWEALRAKVAKFGVRNSLLLAPMPTASTAQILGNNESVEPFTSNMYNRRVLAGEFTIVNKYLLRDLVERGLWTPEVRNQIIADGGSVQNVSELSDELKNLYKTVWEVKQRTIIDMAADRGAYICQSQSMNLHIAEPSVRVLSSVHFYTWRKGLKTGIYYLRTRPRADAIQFTVDQASLQKTRSRVAPTENDENNSAPVNQVEEEEPCLSCGA